MSDDPERLLAEALRAQARNAPPQAAEPRHSPPPVVETPGGYGLLSGAGEGSLERERAALDEAVQAESASASAPEPEQAGQSLDTRWVLLLAAALGLAAGTVVGLLTLL
ncbi:hypothetical protein SacmaDRAFT_5617 [Saccharomonospora marina XMU15]|uniref:Uncharacterized protein n=1 Tax=Saccharomonospora marina XMU15 TaxID=882083 RepID=H5XB03_9PSEU|nr:hypothetical protein [Saccharomonospora marina]EHR53733.1 hypothetical protein SacmaDRAFT_5617 [Saccharomonospora marina XMU15]